MSWLLAFLGFAALIILHESGHFTAAKAVGMRVERFALFFPPLVRARQRGETEYAIGSIPLGGYVKITGMNPAEEIPPEVAHRAYYRQPVWKRIVVIAAGPAVNIALAFVILAGVFWANGTVEPPPRGRHDRSRHARGRRAQARRRASSPSTASRSRRHSDRRCVDSRSPRTSAPARQATAARAAEPVTLRVRRGGSRAAPSRPRRSTTRRRKRPLLGFAFGRRRAAAGRAGRAPPS